MENEEISYLAEKTGLFSCLNPFAYSIDAERGRHLHQLRKNDLSGLTLIKALHKRHIEFDKIECDALQYIER
jgi:hypothetical protein